MKERHCLIVDSVYIAISNYFMLITAYDPWNYEDQAISNHFICVTAKQDNWNYYEQDNWPGFCTVGQNQSPTNIWKGMTILQNSIPALNFQNWDKAVPTTATNDGHSVTVKVPGNIRPTISGGGLSGTYVFENMHFHWPAEHTIERQRFDLEGHIVFYSAKFSNFTVASKNKNGVAVIAIFYNQIVIQGPAVFDKLAFATQKLPRLNSQATTDVIAFRDLLPNKPNSFYHYTGSLTTPECNEVVSWYILKDVGRIHFKQFQYFTTLYGSNNQLLAFTNRQVQPLNGRHVYLKLH